MNFKFSKFKQHEPEYYILNTFWNTFEIPHETCWKARYIKTTCIWVRSMYTCWSLYMHELFWKQMENEGTFFSIEGCSRDPEVGIYFQESVVNGSVWCLWKKLCNYCICVAATIVTSPFIWFTSGLNGFLVAAVPLKLVNIQTVLSMAMSAMK